MQNYALSPKANELISELHHYSIRGYENSQLQNVMEQKLSWVTNTKCWPLVMYSLLHIHLQLNNLHLTTKSSSCCALK